MGKRCSGYRDEASILFRNADVSSLAQPSASRGRRRPRTEEGSESEHSGSTTSQRLPQFTQFSARFDLQASDSVVMQQGWHSPPPRMEPEQWSTHAVPLVLSMLSALKLDGSRYFGQAEFLPRMLFRQSEDAPLTLCCKALGLSFLANKSRMDKANTIRDRAYGQALAAANGLVSDPNLCREDETPVSVWLLSLYEIVTGAHSPTTVTIPTITWSIHTQGLLELMRLRGPEQLQTYTGRNIFGLLAPSVRIRSLVAGIECPSFIKTWLDDLLGRNQTIDADLVRLNGFAHTTALVSAIMCRTLCRSSPELLGWEIDSVWDRVQATEALFYEAMDDNLLGETMQFMLDLAHTAFLQPEAAVDHNQISAITTHGHNKQPLPRC
ncbi:hypothetical protein LTR70_009343 [Exophiala xenobiotica]|uniref:Uncharacterized protein n=1 Tax=Lithohypha guttulata TaxID=1690604 RepID=A0ABR0JXU2_9EURO|nr:hypothetical protein LTR24_009163 [Lithohypha guttulata]KAK5310615.1 hypothetical protein LTR70_009343 [Exophiala xenobiotica]